MAYEVTATRKRPQRFEDLVGQGFVVSTLRNAIEQGRIAHAYLFSGPRGVGKTTSARLLAKALNCVNGPTSEPCGECDNCRGIAKGSSLDVIEIDGASNTGVNDVRVIKEEVMFPPTSSRYKIYIIDEVHMLSQSAFNALLKTIEEPPEYVVFIFATTETQKVPATIRSRCQQFNFQLIPLETIKSLLEQAASEMGIEADSDALFWIAKEATGSMRDAYTLFDQVVAFSNGRITLAQIREKLGLVGVDRINTIMEDVLARNQSASLDKVHELLARGMSIEQIIKDFSDYFRSLLLIKKGVKSENVLGEQIQSVPADIRNAFNEEQLESALDMFLNLYRDIRYSLNPRFELELAISKLSKLRYVASTASIIEQIARLKNDLLSGAITPLNPALADQKTVQPEAAVAPEIKEEVKAEEPVAEPASEPVPEPEVPVEEHVEEPAPEPEPQPEIELTLDALKDILPDGTRDVKVTDNGLVLVYDNKFYYQMAIRSRLGTQDRIRERCGKDINVVPSYSESAAPAPAVEKAPEPEVPAEEPVAEEPAQEETPAVEEPPAEEPSVEAEPAEESLSEPDDPMAKRTEEQKNLIDDILLCFDGREER
ncbi:MAG: DNA polymerase III subunit gamma/tau [Spirochaetales bacterium]|nr:DNA polymerase III subunit gamma/tau [Spirochaetales bacterium]